MDRALPRRFFERPPPTVARKLLGQHIVHAQDDGQDLVARIVETEAYLGPEDPGSHATRGQSTQAGAMWGPPGQAYVYICYGIHQMLNVVAREPDGVGAVLLRAAEPIQGLETMRQRRGDRDPETLLSGPGNLAKALGVERRTHEAQALTEGALHLAQGDGVPDERVERTGRIGLSQGGDRPLRFLDGASPSVSSP